MEGASSGIQGQLVDEGVGVWTVLVGEGESQVASVMVQDGPAGEGVLILAIFAAGEQLGVAASPKLQDNLAGGEPTRLFTEVWVRGGVSIPGPGPSHSHGGSRHLSQSSWAGRGLLLRTPGQPGWG